ncbi:MAG: nicotinamide-nucleotide amidohydrolase family protein [Bacteroidia bacterium]|nr:nicotinamide-nucleotide amidohydrolase family protein [Bacteroidia bacterium]
MTRISFINIGNELLKGTIVNTNASNAGLILRKFGYRQHRVVMIPDTKEAIKSSLEEELNHSDVVFISGGLGPTKDDITKYTLAEHFGGDWVLHQPTLDFITDRFKRAGLELNELTQGQARVPDSCEVMLNERGTAPGMIFNKDGKYVFSMPGVPYEMLYMLEFKAIPKIQSFFPSQAYHFHTFRLAGIPESDVANRMETIEEELPQSIQIAYLPRLDGLWLELSAQQENEEETIADLEAAITKVRELFKDKSYAEGDRLIAEEVQSLFLDKKITLATAESITGGRIGARLVEVSGSSTYFKGSVVAYDVEVKKDLLKVPSKLIEEHGVVSEEVALAMAEGVRKLLNADVGLATTGYAESGENHAPEVWIALSGESFAFSRHARLRTVREVNLDRTAYYAMQLCLKKLKEAF